MQRHTVHRRGHAEFANAVIDVTTAVVVGGKRPDAARLGVVRSRQIGAAADRIGQIGVDLRQCHFARLAGRDLLRFVDQRLDITIEAEAFGEIASHAAQELVPIAMLLEPVAPIGAGLHAAIRAAAPVRHDVIGNFERGRFPAEHFAGSGDFVIAQRRAMRRAGTLLVGRSLADHRLARDQRGTVVGNRFVDGAPDIVEIMPVAADDVPPGRFIARLDVLAGRQVGGPIDGDVVIVPQHGHPAELEMPCKADRFVIDAFHQASVAGDHPSAVVDKLVPESRIEMAFGHRHADTHGQALTQRAGGRFDAVEQEVLRMAGAGAAYLPEVADIFHRRCRIAGQVQQAVDQHRTMPRRQHETVAIGPVGNRGIVLQVFTPQHGRDIGHAHRHTRVPRIRRLDRIHRERPDGVGHRDHASGGETH